MNHPLLSPAIENSHIIQVYTTSNTIWRGEEWSSISLDVIVDQSIIENKDHHILVAFLEGMKDKTLHLPWDSEQVTVDFEKHALQGHPYEADVKQDDTKNKLKVNVHKDLFQHGDQFRVIVAAQMKSDRTKSVVFGASQHISVTKFALSIEQRFDNHDAVVKVDDSTYVYYSKLASKSHGLQVAIHLLSDDGEVWKSKMPAMKLQTQLVYEDGIPVPIMPMKPLKITGRRHSSGTVSRSEKPILRNLDNEEPCLGKNDNSTLFRFHLEEVTYHHHGHDGFKIKVSVDSSRNIVVHPGVMKELIVVLSKPKRLSSDNVSMQQSIANMKSMNRKTFVVQKREANNKCSNKRKLSDSKHESNFDTTQRRRSKRSKVVAKDKNSVMNSLPPTAKAFVQISDILQAYGFNGMCFQCRSPVDIKTILRAEYHTVDCTFVEKILPLFQNVDTSKLSDYQNDDKNAHHMVKIMNCQSFEDLCKDLMMNTASCEVFDANVFGVEEHDDTSDDSSVHSHQDTSSVVGRSKHLNKKMKAQVLESLDSKKDDRGANESNTTTLPLLTGKNIFRTKLAMEATSANEPDDFLSFLDQLVKDEHEDNDDKHHHRQVNDIPLKGVQIKKEELFGNHNQEGL